MVWWKSLLVGESKNWKVGTFVDPNAPVEELLANESYLTITLRSMHLVNQREGLTRLCAVVHACTSHAHDGVGERSVHVLTTPTALQEVDPSHLDRVVTESTPILGPVPYRGGEVKVEIGLFSVGISSFTTPFINVLSGLSREIGVSRLPAHTVELAKILNDGMNAFGVAVGESRLEIGLSKSFARATTGCFYVMGAPEEKLPSSKLIIDLERYLIHNRDGTPIPYPYFVFTIDQSKRRDDFARIPELLVAYNQLADAVRSNAEQSRIDAYLVGFANVTRWCPDFLESDANALIERVTAKARPAGPRSIGNEPTPFPELHEI